MKYTATFSMLTLMTFFYMNPCFADCIDVAMECVDNTSDCYQKGAPCDQHGWHSAECDQCVYQCCVDAGCGGMNCHAGLQNKRKLKQKKPR